MMRAWIIALSLLACGSPTPECTGNCTGPVMTCPAARAHFDELMRDDRGRELIARVRSRIEPGETCQTLAYCLCGTGHWITIASTPEINARMNTLADARAEGWLRLRFAGTGATDSDALLVMVEGVEDAR